MLKTTNPIVTSRHRGFAKVIRSWSYRTIFRWTDAVWTLSEDESEEMRLAYPEFASLFRVVANPYVTPAMLANRQERSERTEALVCSIARLTAQKRLDRLIKAFQKVETADAILTIYGEGEDRSQLEKLVQDLGLGDRIRMPGYSADISGVLHEADLFVLTSDYEGLPAALLEAMASNCRVLSTDCFPAARSMLSDLSGAAIINNTTPEGLARQIDAALTESRPSNLRKVAEVYSVSNGIMSHLNALTPLMPHW